MPDLSVSKTFKSNSDVKKTTTDRPTTKAPYSQTDRRANKHTLDRNSRSPPRRRSRCSRSSSSSSSSSSNSDSNSSFSSNSKMKRSKEPIKANDCTDSPDQVQRKDDSKSRCEFNKLAKDTETDITVSSIKPSLQESNDKTNTSSIQRGLNRDKLSSGPRTKDSLLVKKMNEHENLNRVLVDKLTKNITKAHISEIFSVWGEIVTIDFPPDRIHSEFNRGYGYIEYATSKAAQDAVSYMNGGQVDGQEVVVSIVYPRSHAHINDRPAGRKSPDEKLNNNKREQDSKHDPDRSRNRSPNAPRPSRTVNSTDVSRDRNRANEDKRLDARTYGRNHERPDRSRDTDRLRDRNRRDRDRGYWRNENTDRFRRTRRGSSGSPFANRTTDRQRSPIGSRYRRPSPPRARARRSRSRSPPSKSQPLNARNGVDAKASNNATRRNRNGTTRSSSSSSSSSNSSSSSSGSSSSSSSSSSRSRS